jgi:uncharacterized iron-regulated protein
MFTQPYRHVLGMKRAWSRIRCLLLAVTFTATLQPATAISADMSPTAPPPWTSTLLADHPLVGRIWRARDGTFVTPDVLAKALSAARYVLLGETHDNPDHHRIEAWVVATLFAARHRPGLAIEMLRADQQAALDDWRKAHAGDAGASLGATLDWQRSGWPDWRHYAPVVAPFLSAGMPVVAANLSHNQLRAVLKDGYGALGTARVRTLALDRPVAPAIMEALARELVAAHCGQLKPAQAEPFARVQVARDATLADGLLTAAARAPEGTAVLVAGSGHVRKDRGVPFQLARRGVTSRIVTLAPV